MRCEATQRRDHAGDHGWKQSGGVMRIFKTLAGSVLPVKFFIDWDAGCQERRTYVYFVDWSKFRVLL